MGGPQSHVSARLRPPPIHNAITYNDMYQYLPIFAYHCSARLRPPRVHRVRLALLRYIRHGRRQAHPSDPEMVQYFSASHASVCMWWQNLRTRRSTRPACSVSMLLQSPSQRLTPIISIHMKTLRHTQLTNLWHVRFWQSCAWRQQPTPSHRGLAEYSMFSYLGFVKKHYYKND